MISVANQSRIRRLAILFAKNSTAQIWIQACGFLASLILLRALPLEQYAFYTIASGYQGVLTLMSDLALSMSVTTFAASGADDLNKVRNVIRSALHLKTYLAIIAFVILAPVHWYLLYKQNAGWLLSSVILVPPTIAVVFQIRSAIFGTALRLLDRFDNVFKTEAKIAALRPALIGAVIPFAASATVALTLNSIVVAIGSWFYAREARHAQIKDGVVDKSLVRKIRQLAWLSLPNTVFYCVQGQLPMWIISVFGSTQNVAEVGALSRLGMIIGLGGSFVGTVVAPKFAKRSDVRSVYKIFFGTVCIAAASLSLLFAASYVVPELFLMILGPNFGHLGSQLLISVGCQCIAGISAVMFALTSARGWIRLCWLSIPATIAVQIAAAAILPLNTTTGVLWFQLVTALPAFLLNYIIFFDGASQLRKKDVPESTTD